MKFKKVMGHVISRNDNTVLTSLVGHTALAIGIAKKRLKKEDQLWHITETMFGMRREPGEEFVAAVRRIRSAICKMTPDERVAKRAGSFHRLDFGKLPDPKGKGGVDAYRRKHLVLVTEDGKNVFNNVREHASRDKREEFYKSWEWRTLRMKIIKQYGRRCQCCGATPSDRTVDGKPVRIVVDHIKPLSKYWQLRLVPSNLQILCDECNQGKGAWDETDHRFPVVEETEVDHLTAEYREIMRDDGAA